MPISLLSSRLLRRCAPRDGDCPGVDTNSGRGILPGMPESDNRTPNQSRTSSLQIGVHGKIAGIAFVLAIGAIVGLLSMSPPEFIGARYALLVAAIALVVTYLDWVFSHPGQVNASCSMAPWSPLSWYSASSTERNGLTIENELIRVMRAFCFLNLLFRTGLSRTIRSDCKSGTQERFLKVLE